MRARCPSCETVIDASNTHCPVCLRERPENERKTAGAASASPAWKAALAVAVIAAAAWATRRSAVQPQADPAQEAAPPLVVETAEPAVEPEPQPVAEPVPPPPGEPTVKVVESPMLPARARKPEPARTWEVTGQAYDLLTLKPLNGARLTFQDKTSGAIFTAVTSRAGRYEVDLPRLREGGYEVSVRRRGYADIFLEEMSPPYRSQSPERRRQAAEQVAGSALLHVPLLPEYESRSTRYDVALFPRR